jgi:tryptophanyl-tRNA synthetase
MNIKIKKKRIFSGIRATGRLHVGNYLGMVKGMLQLQDDPQYELFFAVVDLHAMTTPYDKKTLAQKTRDVVLDYLAAGLDPKRSHVLLQSKVADIHSELMLHFSTVMSVARMQHLPTYKEKVKQYPNDVTMALLNYPILMAADILAYKSELVPVGIDQEPHLEVAREVARKMNDKYATDFPEPKRYATQGEYVPSLLGEGKMSKTVEGSYINLTDSLDTIRQRLAKVPTDSGKGEISREVSGQKSIVSRYKSGNARSFGTESLLTFVELFEGGEKRRAYDEQYQREGIRYKELKEELAKSIYRELMPIQEKRKALEAKAEYVDSIIKEGAEKARKIASETLGEVRAKMGLIH